MVAVVALVLVPWVIGGWVVRRWPPTEHRSLRTSASPAEVTMCGQPHPEWRFNTWLPRSRGLRGRSPAATRGNPHFGTVREPVSKPAVRGLSIPVRLDAAGHAALVVGALPLKPLPLPWCQRSVPPPTPVQPFPDLFASSGGVLSGSDRFTTVMLATHISDYSARTNHLRRLFDLWHRGL